MKKRSTTKAKKMRSTVGKALVEIRIATGLSVREFAHKLGYDSHTSYQYYEDEYKKDRLPLDLIDKVVEFVRPYEVDRNLLLSIGANLNHLTSEPGNLAEGLPSLGLKIPMPIQEIDLRQVDGDGELAADVPIIAEWRLPADLVGVATNATAERMRIVTVVGDAMAPTFRTGQKLMVDLSDTRPTPSGVFLVWDGLADDIRNVAYIPHSDPPMVRIFPDNTTKYHAYERELSQAHIRGRVLGLWTWV